MGQLVDLSPPVGMDLENDDCTLIAHAAFVRGDVTAISRVITTNDGSATVTSANNLNLFTKTKACATANLPTDLYAVALEAIASGALGRFRVFGVVDAKMAADVAANAGTIFRATNAATTLTAATAVADATGTQKVIALACNGLAVTVANNPLCPVYFNGLEGWTSSAT